MVALTSSVLARRFGFHQPPFNSVDHLHLHCFALPFLPRYLQYSLLLNFPHGPKLQISFFFLNENVTSLTDGKLLFDIVKLLSIGSMSNCIARLKLV